MLKPIRKTANGMEYWDTEAKKVIIAGVDLARGKDKTIIVNQDNDGKVDVDLDDMNAEQLLSFAKHNEIKVPGTMKNEDTIRKHIAEQLKVDGE